MAARRTDGLRGQRMAGEPLAGYTSWRVGGPADELYRPADADDLAAYVAQLPRDVPVLWLGLGSNLLVRDGGFRGAVIATHGALGHIAREADGTVLAEAGVACAKLARRCAGWSLGPAAFFAGIPGTVGGALAMNAGAFGGETWNQVSAVLCLDRAGMRRWRDASEFAIGYRSVAPSVPGEWFMAARLHFNPDPDADRTAIQALLQQRKASQPIGAFSCGSVFRNPAGDHAARLIEAAQLKGTRIGGARVSQKHANFIINDGSATAADIEALIAHVSDTVARVHGIRLQPEVHIVGVSA